MPPADQLDNLMVSLGWRAIAPDSSERTLYPRLVKRAIAEGQPEVHDAILARMANDSYALSLHANALFECWTVAKLAAPIVALRQILDQNPSMGWSQPGNMALVFHVIHWEPTLMTKVYAGSAQDLMEALLESVKLGSLYSTTMARQRVQAIHELGRQYPDLNYLAQLNALNDETLDTLGMTADVMAYRTAGSREMKLTGAMKPGKTNRDRSRPRS